MTIDILCPPPADHPAAALGADALLRHAEGHLALWWQRTPPVAGARPGLIGQFQAASPQAAADLLRGACHVLCAQGCTVAIGPMDGSTWRSYRFTTWRDGSPRFLLEGDQPDTWPTWWQEAGFVPRDEYWSARVEDLTAADPRLLGVRQRLAAAGVVVRPLRSADLHDDLRRIYAVSAAAFTANVLYTPISEADFLAMYTRVLPLVRPDLSRLAEQDGRPVGFVFALPDAEEARRGLPVTTLVVKTLAVLPGREWAGLGKVLLEDLQQAAHRAGFRRAIHAYMHAANGSRNLGADAVAIRRYTLYQRPLA
jgi:GNAT superfamily N-acetyltransferase